MTKTTQEDFNLGGFSIHHMRLHMCRWSVSIFCFNFWQFHRMGGGGMDSGHLLSKTISKSFQKTLSIFRLWRLAPQKEVLCSAAACTWPRVLLHFHKTSSIIMFSVWVANFFTGVKYKYKPRTCCCRIFFLNFKSPIIWEKTFIGKFRHFST